MNSKTRTQPAQLAPYSRKSGYVPKKEPTAWLYQKNFSYYNLQSLKETELSCLALSPWKTFFPAANVKFINIKRGQNVPHTPTEFYKRKKCSFLRAALSQGSNCSVQLID